MYRWYNGEEYLQKESTELKLEYMHLEGRILWYKTDKALKDYIFHNVDKEIQNIFNDVIC